MTRNWYVANTQTGREALAQAHLSRQGFNVWLPTFRRIVRHARREEEKNIPLFPGYLFVEIDVERERWRSVNGTIGVRSLVMEGEKPLPCPKGLVEAMSVQAQSHRSSNLTENFPVDDEIQHPEANHAGLREKLIGLDNYERIHALLQLMREKKISDPFP